MNAMPDLASFGLSCADGVARIDFSRPERANALDLAMWHELGAAFRWADTAPAVRVVVLGGRGRHFTAGIDLAFLTELRAGLGDVGPGRLHERLRLTILELQATVSAIEACRKPVIAELHGACIGGGIDIACACDLRYASADARFSVKEIDLAIVADLGTLQRLPRLVGDGVARELIYTAREFGADEALRIGFVSGIEPDAAALAARVTDVARQLAAKSPLAVRGVKHALAYSREHSVAEGLEHVAALNAGLLLAPDVAEAVAAFVGRRTARFDD